VWLIASPSPNHYVDVTDLFDRKLAALQAHKSQTAHRDRLAVRRLDATCTTKDQSRPLPS
jgi:LmbE family N-acetylglucosaminyl deacetylase